MTPDAARAAYRRGLGQFEVIAIRRYTGAGASRPRFDWDVQARVLGADGKDLVGPITQDGVMLIVLREDLEAAAFPFPVQNGPNWKAVVRGMELQIGTVDDNTRRLAGELIAYEIKASG